MIYPGEGGNLCSMLVWTVCQLPCVDSCMWAWLKLQVNIIIFKDSFILPVKHLNLSIQDMLGRDTYVSHLCGLYINCPVLTVAFQHD